MASVTSLGVHRPTGLPHLVRERILPQDPNSDLYNWQIETHYEDGISTDDELITTETCVVWSRGGLVRKIFRFEIEDEPVSTALIASFPEGRRKSGFPRPMSLSEAHEAEQSSKAIVIVLKTQAHVFFLNGPSHMIHLPFEVEYAVAAPIGLIIQRNVQPESLGPVSFQLPHVPPNSFKSSQPLLWSIEGSQQNTFQGSHTESLRHGQQIPLGILGNAWQLPAPKDDSNWPRLFSLTDPLAELGLVVTGAGKEGYSRAPDRLHALDPAEEMIYVSNRDEFTTIPGDGHGRLMLAVTLNRLTSMYTVWRMIYIGADETGKSRSAGKSDVGNRRRSSFNYGTATGSATPVPFRESMGPSGLNLNKPLNMSKTRTDENFENEKLDFVSALDPDFEHTDVPRRKSRRVSSMLARSDLSASNERSAFSDLAAGHHHGSNRRIDSQGSQHTRKSMGSNANVNVQGSLSSAAFGNSIGSLLEAPVDNLLEELNAGGDFEGFTNMGLDDEDFEGLRREIVFSKIESIPVEPHNIRYSSQSLPARDQCRAFAMLAPTCASEDTKKRQIAICILDSEDKRLLVLKFRIQLPIDSNHQTGIHDEAQRQYIILKYDQVIQAKGVLDACKVMDGDISRILLLTQSANGLGDLSLQAPWSASIKINLPDGLKLSNLRSVDHDASPLSKREGGLKRVLSHRPRVLASIRNPLLNGLVDIVDNEGISHQICIRMQPRTPLVSDCLNVCRNVLSGFQGGEHFLVAWWHVMLWLRGISNDESEPEWSAFVILLFASVIGLQANRLSPSKEKRRSRGILRSSSGAHMNESNWQAMLAQETIIGASRSQWIMGNGWAWLGESADDELEKNRNENKRLHRQTTPQVFDDEERFLARHIRLSKEFAGSQVGEEAVGPTGYLPTSNSRGNDKSALKLAQITLGLHLLREDQKLDVTIVDSLDNNSPSLTPILAQLCSWFGWNSWSSIYQVENVTMMSSSVDSTIHMHTKAPCDPPSIYDWVGTSLQSLKLAPFITLGHLMGTQQWQTVRPEASWATLTPRTALFWRFFFSLQKRSDQIGIVEALYAAGATTETLETLPEGIIIPLREAVLNCQIEPPVTWSTDLLSLVDRGDMNMLLFPELQKRVGSALTVIPAHEAASDVHSICSVSNETENIGAFDGSAEIDRQSIIRLIFKDDRRFMEAAKILNTSKPTIAKVEPESEWTESDLLEAQKAHAQMLATRTLAIPTGRGLLYFSARIPLLTEKFPMGGFNLHCIMKPANNTVAVDKSQFSEEKVCWAFFHSGVASGLSISRKAKGIDTSWILYNKPAELSNRHAGFLLALGLNGHLKSVAKWVAFKYLTPKHTMTSIGLLLGLAASYLGTMDSLITRLLSVHVTRMLPPGAAELNLSPLTQTSGIMGIGLLYCNTQHRRMSEIMLSEIEYTTTELNDEPLRNEGYRTAAGFALGFINLGKGSDLRGLHDMHLTERLLTVAVGNKKVDLVHTLDKATAGSIVAIALIFMKSENQSLAQKIDVPCSNIQYNHVRPDMFLLRTVSKHLIMWSRIEASMPWIERNLPPLYCDRSRLDEVERLTSEDLPFYDMIAGLCFSIALRNAGSGLTQVRDLLIYYLDQIVRICSLPARTFDHRFAQITVRNCQDLLALSLATVMAGTGDLIVFRRLRAMHGRDDADTPYGSHLAAHIAIGVLFLGGGTHTFGTSNLAIASLLVAFYPLFPTDILDNKSHLQAFRHFWVLATEPRCLVTRDVDTNRPVSVPILISMRGGGQFQAQTPCLLPELSQLAVVSTDTQEYWSVVLDFEKNSKHLEAFRSTQTVFVRRRPAYDASTSILHATLQALDDRDSALQQPLEWLFDLPSLSLFTAAERALVLLPDSIGSMIVHASAEGTLVDVRLVLEKATIRSGKRDRLLGLKMLFEWADKMRAEGKDLRYIRADVLDQLRVTVWMMSRQTSQVDG